MISICLVTCLLGGLLGEGSTKLLKAIMLNIIRNKGTFILPKKKVSPRVRSTVREEAYV